MFVLPVFPVFFFLNGFGNSQDCCRFFPHFFQAHTRVLILPAVSSEEVRSREGRLDGAGLGDGRWPGEMVLVA